MCQNFAENFNTRYDVETNEPQFITKGHLYRAVVGDTIVLPCKVKNLGSYILLWRRSAAVLTAANLMVTRDARLKMVDGYNLQISDVKISDAGDYVCQIGDQEPRDQVHTLEILVPPSVRSVPDHGLVSARQGNTVNLECRTSGNPVPTIHWFRKVSKSLQNSIRFYHYVYIVWVSQKSGFAFIWVKQIQERNPFWRKKVNRTLARQNLFWEKPWHLLRKIRKKPIQSKFKWRTLQK